MRMLTLPKHFLTMIFALTAALSVGLIGCDKSSAEADADVKKAEAELKKAEAEAELKKSQAEAEAKVEPKSDDEGVTNLCTAYDSCNDCIAGQMTKGKSEGEAQTQCGLAVTGCWTTWTKPVVCGDKTYDS